MKKLTIEEMQKIAEKRGGMCLSTNYPGRHKKLKWRCEKNHIWEATAGNVIKGSWCPYCVGRHKTILDIQKMAKVKGGECLSYNYLGMHKKHKWKCKEGHVWEATPDNIKYGSWCPYCSHHVKAAIEDMQKLAEKKGGKCLSKTYITTHTSLQWQCNEGHVWETTPHSVKEGHWCPHCAGLAKLNIEEMQRRAKQKGGECLSNDYVNSSTKLQWKCNEGHIWRAKPSDITDGRWCPTCWNNKRGQTLRHPIAYMQKLAESKGGKCLSDDYGTVKKKLKWQCKDGHVWWTAPANIIQGRWCPICSEGISERVCRKIFEEIFSEKFPKKKPKWLINSRGNGMELDGYCEKLKIAFEYNGIQHYKQSYYTKERSLERIKEDDNVKRILCKKYEVTLIEIPYTVDFEGMSTYITKECKLRGINIQILKPLDYRLMNIYSPEKIKEMRNIAETHDGKCLSQNYINKETKLQWQCKEGHVWWARAGQIKRGGWCPKCGAKRRADMRRSNIQEMQEIAESKGGKCLSDVYVNSATKLKWQCNKEHVWEATPGSVKTSNWCPYCAHRLPYRVRLTLEDMQNIARNKGGRCLSDKYLGNRVKMKWQCKEGHVWETRPQNVREGAWCPICARKRQGNRKKQI